MSVAVADARRVHSKMIEAVLAGGGVARVAQIAAEHLRGTVRIEVADLDVTAPAERRGAHVTAHAPIRSGDEVLGAVELLDGGAPDAHEILELAALAALTAVTLRDGHITQRRATAALFEEIARGLDADEAIGRARRLGADLADGAHALAARPATDRVLAAIASELPGSLTAVRGDRAEALIPASLDPLPLARRLRAGLSPAGQDFAAALRFAAVALEVDADPAELLSGSWRLLLGSDAAALGALIDSTVGPAGELLDTLRAYITHGASVSATAAAIYAHRHTVSNRLERLRALTGHDPQTPAGQTQLALGLQALEVRRAVRSAGGGPSGAAS
jgi:hypothetical protein